jgi:hypothetical protein
LVSSVEPTVNVITNWKTAARSSIDK